MSERSFRFTHAITRRPAASATGGIRAIDTGAPDVALMLRHHDDYVAALRAAGAAIVELPDLSAYPDAQFVEDTALCLPEGAVVMRPGAASRLGEAAEMAPTLRSLYDQVLTIEGPGTIEGGDILVTEREILVGRSARTDAAGIAELTGLVARWGYSVRELQTPPGVLHFKTDCSLLDAETVLLVREYAAGVHRYELGLVKGRIDAGESPIEAANRELMEEAGYGARDLQVLRSITLAPVYMSHQTHLVLARDLYPQRLPGDEPEELEVVPWKLDDLGELILREDFSEGRTIASLFIAREWLRQQR